jgi:ataxia telangiectasia mutated family protein
MRGAWCVPHPRAGGINLPKIVECRGSDGMLYRQLVKGRDDMRQDAVMQQVFKMVNGLLARTPATRTRNLMVRTYTVIPITPKSGVLEWVKDTRPLGDWLIGPQEHPHRGAHVRYRPADMTPREARAELQKAAKAGTGLRAAYNSIARQLQPVLGHFFLEHYPDSVEWFERRLAYTRSVAAWSMVGYILGLGDRHMMNILIDTRTAELVHIDLGVAFEQGKMLPTPELVPFRLTRDLVDGMGVLGVRGVYTRCCEHTLAVLRTNHDAVLTILDVFVHDPLSSWTVSPKALRRQREDQNESTAGTAPSASTSTSTSRRASTSRAGAGAGAGAGAAVGQAGAGAGEQHQMARAAQQATKVLLRLNEKLRGIEAGVELTIAGQVNQLIHVCHAMPCHARPQLSQS